MILVTKHLCGAATDFAITCAANYAHSINEKYEPAKNESSEEKRSRVVKRMPDMLLTFCCHHRCSWDSYAGKEFFLKHNLTSHDFRVMSRISAWYTCGNKWHSVHSTTSTKSLSLTSNISAESNDISSNKNNQSLNLENDYEQNDPIEAYKVKDEVMANEKTLKQPQEIVVKEELGDKNSKSPSGLEAESVVITYSGVEKERIGKQCKYLINLGRLEYLEEKFGKKCVMYNYVPSDVTLENVALFAK